MAEFFDDGARLDKLISSLEPKFRLRFLEVVKSIKDSNTLDALEALVVAGRVEEALVSAELAALKLSNMFGDAFVLAGNETAKVIENALEVIVNFDQVNVRALSAMQQNQLRLVREFVTEQRRATRLALIDGIERGVNPREMARAFKDSIGLTAKQQQFIINYRTQLETLDARALGRQLRDKRFDSTVLRAIREGRPLTREQIDKMVGRYQDKWLRYRSEVIARTEALNSAHSGTEEMYRQAIDNGTLDAEDLIRTWDTSKDGRERDHHKTMDKQRRRIGEVFVSGLGNTTERPGAFGIAEEDIQCRCVLTTRFTDSAKLRDAQSAPALVPIS